MCAGSATHVVFSMLHDRAAQPSPKRSCYEGIHVSVEQAAVKPVPGGKNQPQTPAPVNFCKAVHDRSYWDMFV